MDFETWGLKVDSVDESPVPALAGAEKQWLPLLCMGLRASAIFLFIPVTYLSIVRLLVLFRPGFQTQSVLDVLNALMAGSIPILLLVLVIYKAVEMAVYDRPEHPVPHLLGKLWEVIGNPARMAAGLPIFFAVFLFMYDFAVVKANISGFQPFAWDKTFDQWDAALHFGFRPWELLQPVVGYVPVTFLLNLNYNAWFLAMNMFMVHYAFMAAPGESRSRFFLTFMLIWMIGGGFLATVLSSAGPCYFGAGRLGLSPDPYAGLMAYLRHANDQIPIWSVSTQDMLWSFREQGSAFGGVSAMPSMHNGTALLFILASAGFPLWVRLLVILHAILVFIGSVHLGWHYAVDAYLAWGVTLFVWWAVKPLVNWWEASPQARDFQTAIGVENKTA